MRDDALQTPSDILSLHVTTHVTCDMTGISLHDIYPCSPYPQTTTPVLPFPLIVDLPHLSNNISPCHHLHSSPLSTPTHPPSHPLHLPSTHPSTLPPLSPHNNIYP